MRPPGGRLPEPNHALHLVLTRFLDAQGFAWHVMELTPRDVGSGSGYLYFFSGGSTSRLARYPDDWESFGWRGLERLRAQAEVLSSDAVRSLAPNRHVPAQIALA